MASINTTRRGFLSGKYLTQSGREQIAGQQETWGPAPPCLSYTLTLDSCIDCDGPCADACPQNIIGFYPADHLKAAQAYLDFTDAGCTFCQACVDVCPAAQSQSKNATTVLGTAFIDDERCFVSCGVTCISCNHCCPQYAIQRNRHNTPVVNGDLCTGCGSCVAICPTQAISVKVVTKCVIQFDTR